MIELDWAPPAGGVAQRQWWVFDQATGALRFRFDRADDRRLAPWPRSPDRNDAIAYRTRSGGIGLVDPKFGRPRWQVDEPGAPADFVLADDRGVIVAGNFGPVVGLDRATGQRQFSSSLLASFGSSATPPRSPFSIPSCTGRSPSTASLPAR